MFGSSDPRWGDDPRNRYEDDSRDRDEDDGRSAPGDNDPRERGDRYEHELERDHGGTHATASLTTRATSCWTVSICRAAWSGKSSGIVNRRTN
jgi:hypothetical protein